MTQSALSQANRNVDGADAYQLWTDSIKNRDLDTWNVLVDLFADTLRRDIRRSLLKSNLSLEMLEDISRETWLTAFRNIHSFAFESEDHFYHWLRVISCNHIHRARRGVDDGRPGCLPESEVHD